MTTSNQEGEMHAVKQGLREFDAAGNRTDIHRPQTFDPSDYQIVGFADLRPVEQDPRCPEATRQAEADRRAYVKALFGTEFPSRHCAHCGWNPLRWVACAEHKPTGERLVIGEDCADNRLSLENRAEFQMKYVRTHAENVRRQIEKAAQAAEAQARFAQQEPEVASFLNNLPADEDFEFLVEMKSTLTTKGWLTEGQCRAVAKCIAARQAREARKQAEAATRGATTPLAEGRYEVTGIVISTKWVSSDYGDTLKMLVQMADGNRVYGTVPSSIFFINNYETNAQGQTYVASQSNLDAGHKVTFTAKVERSRDDEHFGFFSRPAKASVETGTEVA